MVNKKYLLGTITLLLLVITPGFALGLGVMPAGKLFEYEPGRQHSYNLKIINEAGREMLVSARVQGDLEEQISLSSSLIEFSLGETEKTVTVSLAIPENLEPGLSTTNIFFSESPGGDSDGVVAAMPGVASQARIRVPYPDVYLESILMPIQPRPRIPVDFQVSVLNTGNTDIREAYAGISIYSPQNEYIGMFTTSTESVSVGREAKLKGIWSARPIEGLYLAKGTLHYDGRQRSIEQAFMVGEKKVFVSGLEATSYAPEGVIRLDALLRNNWNEPVLNAFIDFSVLGPENNVVSRFRSSSLFIDEYGAGLVEAFWDSAGLSHGDYDLELNVFFDGSSYKIIQPIRLGMGGVTFLEGPFHIMETGEERKAFPLAYFLLIILILVSLALFYYLKRQKK